MIILNFIQIILLLFYKEKKTKTVDWQLVLMVILTTTVTGIVYRVTWTKLLLLLVLNKETYKLTVLKKTKDCNII